MKNLKFLLPDIDSPEYKARILKSKQEKYNALKCYMMDYWFPLLEHLTFPATLVEIPVDDMIGTFDGNFNKNIISFGHKLHKIINDKKVFLKTSNRSPKDFSYPEAPSVKSGDEAIRMLASSMRTLDDVCDAHEVAPIYVVIRPWIDIEEKTEFRCFVKNKKLVGISQYFYDKNFEYTEQEINNIESDIFDFHEKISSLYEVNDYVFDVFFDKDKKCTLIEINPYGLSDPCLFKTYENFDLGLYCGILTNDKV